MMAQRTPLAQSPVPSFTLQITKTDAERFLDASRVLKEKLDSLIGENSIAESAHNGDDDKYSCNTKNKPLHETMFHAAQLCQHPFLSEFLDKMSALQRAQEPSAEQSPQNDKEIKAAIMLFHDSDKTTKLRHLFSILSSTSPPVTAIISPLSEEEKKDDNPKDTKATTPSVALSSRNLQDLFRTVLMAISCCVHSPQHSVCETDTKNNATGSMLVEGKPESAEGKADNCENRPPKKPKLECSDDAIIPTGSENIEDDFGDACKSPSWDSSLATLRDEDDKMSPCDNIGKTNNLRRDIDDIARYATEELLRFATNKNILDRPKDDKTRTGSGEDKGTVDFATFGDWYNGHGSSIVPWLELLQHSKWKAPTQKNGNSSVVKLEDKGTKAAVTNPTRSASKASQGMDASFSGSPARAKMAGTSRTLVSFDFNGSGSPSPLLINISEDNLFALQSLVNRTNLITCTSSDICKSLLQFGTHRSIDGKDRSILRKDDFKRAIKRIIPRYSYDQLSSQEKDFAEESFAEFFFCFEGTQGWLGVDEVDLNEFAVGFCFFCAGNKSTKLLTGFDLLDSNHHGYLTEQQLSRYLQSYLTMLVAMSLLVPVSKRKTRRGLTVQRRKELRAAVESGAKWTLGHFLKASGQSKNEYTFECFASWYSAGGYNIAPWLELLDLKKVMTLIGEPHSHLSLPPLTSLDNESTHTKLPQTLPRDRVSSLRRHHSSRRGPPPEVLFTFPLGSRRSLVVLKEDAKYVRGVVEQLGLLTMNPDSLWSALLKAVEKRRKPAPGEVAVYVDMSTFVQCMKEVCPKASRKRSAPSNIGSSMPSSIEEVLANFYQCFDIEQCDSVALDELMGGLTLLCGGKKSTKLAFAFSIFDTRQGINTNGKKDRVVHSLSGEDLFLFLRSILIVTFSTCRQSLDMTDDIVSRCIADTANMICNDVMRHQWEAKQLDRLDFDEFGQWYNDGGFERAPWLELLDLNKWVLINSGILLDEDMFDAPEELPPSRSVRDVQRVSTREITRLSSPSPSPESIAPPPPPEEALDNSFLDEIDSMDEMDMMLMQTTSVDRDELKISKSFSYSHSPRQPISATPSAIKQANPLKFHLVTSEDHGGYMLSLSPVRISHFRRLLEASGLHNLDAETACNQILSRGSRAKLTKKCFDSCMRNLLATISSPELPIDEYTETALAGIFNCMFDAFDFGGTGEVSAIEVACGFTVLCRGKKSDKLEFAFEVLDKKKRGRLSRNDMSNYLQSFLTVLLSIAFSPTLDNDPCDDKLSSMNGSTCERSTSMLIRVVQAGADWAASLAFRDFEGGRSDQRLAMSFDDFASWYTRAGYSSIPWLELLDLQKWAMVPDPNE